MRLRRAWAPVLTRAQWGLCFPAECFSHQLLLLPPAADPVPTKAGRYSVFFPNYLGSSLFAREDSILTEDALGSLCPGWNPVLLLTLHGSRHLSGKRG